MTLQIQKLVEVELLSTGAWGSVTSNSTFAWSDAYNYAAQVRLGDTDGTGKVDWTLDHAVEDPSATTPNWQTLITGDQLSATSQVAVEFESQSVRPLLPYGRLQVVAKSGGAGQFTVANVVAHILADYK